jgi:demethylmenaquinone methyltransferase/2-methoxy-6-polyprenyl-1,4-benzoquinol methylase
MLGKTRPSQERALVDERASQIQKMFDAVAPTYDLLNHLLSANVDKRWRRLAARMAMDDGVTRILDLCTGTAELALCVAEAARPDAVVVGLDFSHAMLIKARRKILHSSLNTAPYLVQADCLLLPFADHSFDLVTVAFGMRNLTDLDRGIREMVRVTRSGGKVLILEFSLPPHGVFRNLYRLYLTRIVPCIGNWLTCTSAYDYLHRSIHSFPDPERFKNMLAAAGLRNVSVIPLTWGIVCFFLGEVP